MNTRRPWSPDSAWADPLIAALALCCFLGVLLALGGRRSKLAPAPGPSLQGRVIEVALGAKVAFGPSLPTRRGAPSAKDLPNPSDRAIAAVLVAETGALEEARSLLDAAPRPSPDFRRAFEAAYGEGPRESRVGAPEDAGSGLATRLLMARLAPPSDRAQLRQEALAAWARRFLLLSAFGLGASLLVLGGLGTGIWLLAGRRPWPPGPTWGLSGRALLLVLLSWFLVLFLSGFLAQGLASFLPGLKPYAVPLGYSLHAAVGTSLLCRAEGIPMKELIRRLCPGRPLRSLALAPAFVGLGLCAVFLVALVLGPFLRGKGNPQQELLESLRQMKGVGPTAALFLTVAGIAPCFEELMMRGLLMGWLRSRKGPALALALSALVFGAIHLQPLALPTLSLLGAAFGLGVLRSGDLRTSILAHGLWNGGLFCLLRLLA